MTRERQMGLNTKPNGVGYTENDKARAAKKGDENAEKMKDGRHVMGLPFPMVVLGPPTADVRDRVGASITRMPDLPPGTPIIKLQMTSGASTMEAIGLLDAFAELHPYAAVVVTVGE